MTAFDMSLVQCGSRIRRSPYYEAEQRYGPKGYTVYNHMLFPIRYDDFVAEYEHLLEHVTLWDVAVERCLEVSGPDGFAFTQLLTPRDLSACAVGQAKYVLVCAPDGGILNDPVLTRMDENRFWLALASSDVLLYAKGLAAHAGLDVEVREVDVAPLQIQGPKSKDVVRALFGDEILELGYYFFTETELEGIPVVVTRTGWTSEVGYEVYLCDSYAVASQAAHHGHDPATAVVRLRPRDGERTLRTDDVVAFLEEEGASVALVLLGGVNYLTGELPDLPTITAATREAGAVSAWDLAHAAGNVPLALHDWGVDWAAWCSYKYLNSGPGAVAGAFVHERHARDRSLPRLAGWWGNDLGERFRMEPSFVPRADAEGWQVSNPPILALAPVRVSLELFDRIGMSALRKRSLRLTGYLEALLGAIAKTHELELITPRDPEARGCQLSMHVPSGARALADRLRAEDGVVCDEREPDVIRLAPVPLYTSFHDVWRAADALARLAAPR